MSVRSLRNEPDAERLKRSPFVVGALASLNSSQQRGRGTQAEGAGEVTLEASKAAILHL